MLSRIAARIPVLTGRALETNGHVFGSATVIGMAALLIVAARHGLTAVVVILGFGLTTIAMAKLWSGLALRAVSIARTLDRHAVFPGEDLRAQIRIENNKALPMPWVEAILELPPGLRAHSDGPRSPGPARIVRGLSLPWYSRMTWNERLAAERRGFYELPGLSVCSGDALGLYPRAKEDHAPVHVVVYPRLYPVRDLVAPRTDAAGERVGVSTLQEDPTRMRGIRDYSPGDSLRRVHWKVTARHSELKVKLFEPAAVSRINLALAVDGFDASDPDDFELAVSAVASIARYCVERQQQVGLTSNAQMGTATRGARMTAAGGGRHLLGMLDLLARVHASPTQPFDVFARELRCLAVAGSALIVVMGRLQQSHMRIFEQLARTSGNFRVLSVDSHAHACPTRFPCTFVRSPDDLLTIGGARG